MQFLIVNTTSTIKKNFQGYHPEVKGVISKDGETIIFSETMKARLGVDYWIKCIGLHSKFTLRAESRFDSLSHFLLCKLEKFHKNIKKLKNSDFGT